MEKRIINFTANGQQLTIAPDHFASDTVSYIEAHFALDESWNGYDSIRAIWTNGHETITTVLNGGVCVVPSEVLTRRSKVTVNLVASLSVNGVLTDRLTSYPVEALNICKKALIEGTETAPLTPLSNS